MNIVGISAHFHNSACCLLQDGALTAAAQEDSFTRIKHDASLPKMAFRYCLKQGRIDINQIDAIAYYEDPTLKLGRQIWMFGPALPKDRAVLLRMNARRPEIEIRKLLGFEGHLEFVKHHESHAASSYYWSGFQESAIMTVDGVGEWATLTYGTGVGDNLEIFEQVEFPDSIGLLYSTITNYLGFSANEGEYKVMGLAPYGKPTYIDKILELIEYCQDGQFRLNLQYFDFTRSDRMYSDEMSELFGHPPRKVKDDLLDFHKDLACSLQFVIGKILVDNACYLHAKTGMDNLCMAGGVALNCVFNSRILKESPFRRLFVQPAANDAGGALGAAAVAHHRLTGRAINVRCLEHVFLGPSAEASSVRKLLNATGIKYQDYDDREQDMITSVADRLAVGSVIGWFQGRMEFGPRALGARSILADPREPAMRDHINALIKHRESFRPFAPSVLVSRAAEHFDINHASPFMLETFQVRSNLSLPAVTHVDGSARVHTVDDRWNPRFAKLLEAFANRTGCPILLNTSFNMKDEPIVCNPIDAILCFVRSKLDALVIEDFIVERQNLPESWSALLNSSIQSKTYKALSRAYTLV